MGTHLTDADYWSGQWRESALPAAIRPETAEPLAREYCRFFTDVLPNRSGRFLEIGCGCSVWLPFFARLGFEIAGLDYSDVGCRQARMILEREGLSAQIYEQDAFSPSSGLLGRFDVVASFGVVEHFTDTGDAVRAFARYLKPGGLLISTCPNMAGLLGSGQKYLNRPVYKRHVSLTVEMLSAAHRAVGLHVIRCAYIGSLDFHVLNLNGAESGGKRLAHRCLMRLSRIGWSLPFSIGRTRTFSSGIACAAALGRGPA
jgi:2-polyprenyl-3-methyl-5-hydroxy-6-metoxy-1,4-benzoquinol methylase